MFRLSALNEPSNDGWKSGGGQTPLSKGTKEAQEAQAFALYNDALQLQQNKYHEEASEVYNQLLTTPLVTEAASTLVDENGEAVEQPLKDPGLILKYSTHNNMASMAAEKGDIHGAMEHCLQAVFLDTTDVTLWQRIGSHAITLGRIALACHAFRSGLQCNVNHWPCLDSLITVLYVLSDYESCLWWIAKALKRDSGYTRGIVYRRIMFKECPHLKADTMSYFAECSTTINVSSLDREEAESCINEAEELREIHRQACVRIPYDDVPILPEIKELSWLDLGRSLIKTYHTIQDRRSHISVVSKVYVNNLSQLQDRYHRPNNNNSSEDSLERGEAESDTRDSFPTEVSDGVSIGSVASTINYSIFETNNDDIESAVKQLLDSLVWRIATEDVTCMNTDSSQSSVLTVSSTEESSRQVLNNLLDTVQQDDPSFILDELISKVEAEVDGSNDHSKGLTLDRIELSIPEDSSNDNSQDGPSSLPFTDMDAKKTKKSLKRKRELLDCTESNKRRSTRNRTLTKKNSDNQEVSNDAPSNNSEDVMDEWMKTLSEDLRASIAKQGNVSSTPATESPTASCDNDNTTTKTKYAASDEAKDVIAFLEKHDSKKTMIFTWMQEFLWELSTKVSLHWKPGLRDVVLKIFELLDSHIDYPHPDDVKEGTSRLYLLRRELFGMLTALEICMDRNDKPKGPFDPFLREHFDKHLLYCSLCMWKPHFFREKVEGEIELDYSLWHNFIIRLQWLRSKRSCQLNESEEATEFLKSCIQIIRISTVRNGESTEVTLPNIIHGCAITTEKANQRILRLNEEQLLNDANKLYDSYKYDEVIDLLAPTMLRFDKCHPERPKHITQLLLSHENLCDVEGLLKSVTHVFKQIVYYFKNVKTAGSKMTPLKLVAKQKEWKQSMITSLEIFDRCISAERRLVKKADIEWTGSIVHSLLAIIGIVTNELDEGKTAVGRKQLTHALILSYMILYKILHCYSTSSEDDDDDAADYPTELLKIAHEQLGERNLCCAHNGKLLRFIIDEVSKLTKDAEFTMDSSDRIYYNSIVDQCFYCLFSFPTKTKLNRLQEHNTMPSTPDWQDCLLMFRHYKPQILPEFDSFKASTVSVEFSTQIFRFLQQVPQSIHRCVPNTDAEVQAFIESDCDTSKIQLKLRSDDTPDDLKHVGDMYYLLADYNLKNSETNQAVKFYLLDLQINPNRFDSWAGVALSRSSQTDDRLRLCEPKERKKSPHKMSKTGIQRRALAALACFKQALSIDSTSTKLWIEYGTLAYWLQSMYSRQLKRKGKLSPEERENLRVKKCQMLAIARTSFEYVKKCDHDDIYDDEWLIEYMLGKVSEKEGNPPSVFLEHYQHAGHLLHQRHAKYPKKILSKYSAVSELAAEALEMYFRIHASALKYVQRLSSESNEEEITPEVIKELEYITDLLDITSTSPFVLRSELKQYGGGNSAPQQQADKPVIPSKLAATSQSSDLTMGSILPDNILANLEIEGDSAGKEGEEEGGSSSNQEGVSSSNEGNNGTSSVEDTPLASPNANQQGSIIVLSSDDDEMEEGGEDGDEKQLVPTRDQLESEASTMFKDIIQACHVAFIISLKRYPGHYKSLYRLASLHATCLSKKKLNWSRDMLFGPSTPWQQLDHMPAPGLLTDRNKTNLFNGVWRIPIDDIDRPGSFAFHLRRCVALLLDVANHLHEHKTLLQIHMLLNRTPDQGKKYLREDDRIRLARRSLVYYRSALHRLVRDWPMKVKPCDSVSMADNDKPMLIQFKSLEGVFNLHKTDQATVLKSGAEDLLDLLMDVYKLYQDTHKHSEQTTRVDLARDPDDISQQHLFAKTYHKYDFCVVHGKSRLLLTALHESQIAVRVEQAIKFCQCMAQVRKHCSNALPRSLSTVHDQSATVTKAVSGKTHLTSPSSSLQSAKFTSKLPHAPVSRAHHSVSSSIHRPELKRSAPVVLFSSSDSSASATPTSKSPRFATGSSNSPIVLSSGESSPLITETAPSLRKTAEALSRAVREKLGRIAAGDSNSPTSISKPPVSLTPKSSVSTTCSKMSTTATSSSSLPKSRPSAGTFVNTFKSVDPFSTSASSSFSSLYKDTRPLTSTTSSGPSSLTGGVWTKTSPTSYTVKSSNPPSLVKTSTSDSTHRSSIAGDSNLPVRVTMVEKDGKTYTKITRPTQQMTGGATVSSRNSFRPICSPAAAEVSPRAAAVVHRSFSVPDVSTDPAAAEAGKPTHRQLFRTTSCVSDATKLKLRSSILEKTSAALIRKPSITEMELIHIREGEEIEEDEDDDDDDVISLSSTDADDDSDDSEEEISEEL